MASIAQKIVGGALKVVSAVATVAGKPGVATVATNLAGKLTGTSNPVKQSAVQVVTGAKPAPSTPAKASAQNLVAGTPAQNTSPAKASADNLKSTKDPVKIIGDITGKTEKTQMTWVILIGGLVVLLGLVFGKKKLFR